MQTFAQSLNLFAENATGRLGMQAVRQIVGATGLIFAAIFAASYWKLIHIGPALEKGVMICLVTTLLALTAVEWMIAKKARA
ncbi:hypothetical protein [Sphingomonas sp. PvP056]|uniref:hypothetical protein n=1 Tax=Sphingomonas sp. PvP056 TaxID=3156392 RepID=UPI00263C8DF6|nr:hypothetical protein [Sphingomonas sp. PsM26]